MIQESRTPYCRNGGSELLLSVDLLNLFERVGDIRCLITITFTIINDCYYT